MSIKNIIIIVVLSLCVGCTCDSANGRNPANDGYVPWWVQDGVPNSEGVIAK